MAEGNSLAAVHSQSLGWINILTRRCDRCPPLSTNVPWCLPYRMAAPGADRGQPDATARPRRPRRGPPRPPRRRNPLRQQRLIAPGLPAQRPRRRAVDAAVAARRRHRAGRVSPPFPHPKNCPFRRPPHRCPGHGPGRRCRRHLRATRGRRARRTENHPLDLALPSGQRIRKPPGHRRQGLGHPQRLASIRGPWSNGSEMRGS